MPLALATHAFEGLLCLPLSHGIAGPSAELFDEITSLWGPEASATEEMGGWRKPSQTLPVLRVPQSIALHRELLTLHCETVSLAEW